MVASIASINDITNNNINSSGSLHEMRYRIKDIVAKYFSDFYSNALVFVLAVFLAASFVSIKAWDNIQNDAKCSDMKGSAEELWRVSCTAVLVPLLLESTLDLVVNFFFSHLREDNTKVVKRLEDPFGHILIICSLIPSSYIPLWIMGNHACISRDTFVSFGHTVAMYGIVGKLQSFSSDLWASTSALWFVLLFASSQIAMIMGLQREDDVIGYDEKTLQIGTTLKLIAFVTFLTTSFRIPLNILFHSKEDVTQNSTSHFFVTRSYLCGILWISVVIFFIQTIHFGLHNMDAYNEMQHDYDIWSFRVKAHIFLVVLTAVLPGRIIRRGLAAMEKNIAIENEMNYKKTFVRYVSHEVR